MYKPRDKTDSSQKAREGFCVLVLVALSPKVYRDPEKIANILAKHREVKSVDIAAGRWELILQVKTKDQNKFYEFLKNVISKENGIVKTSSIVSLKRVKPICS